MGHVEQGGREGDQEGAERGQKEEKGRLPRRLPHSHHLRATAGFGQLKVYRISNSCNRGCRRYYVTSIKDNLLRSSKVDNNFIILNGGLDCQGLGLGLGLPNQIGTKCLQLAHLARTTILLT